MVLWREATHPVLLFSHQWIFLFPAVITALKGKRFQDVEDIKKNVMAELNTFPLEEGSF
jgi:hypothetical protein